MLNLIMVLHCHQPVGNFDGVFEEAYNKSYLPFVQALEKHPYDLSSLRAVPCGGSAVPEPPNSQTLMWER